MQSKKYETRGRNYCTSSTPSSSVFSPYFLLLTFHEFEELQLIVRSLRNHLYAKPLTNIRPMRSPIVTSERSAAGSNIPITSTGNRQTLNGQPRKPFIHFNPLLLIMLPTKNTLACGDHDILLDGHDAPNGIIGKISAEGSP